MEALFADPFTLLMLGALGLLIIFMFRSSRKRQAAARELQEKMQPGVEVMLQSGIFATVTSIDEDSNRVTVESGPGTTLIVHRNAVASIVPEPVADIDVVAPDDDPKFGEVDGESKEKK